MNTSSSNTCPEGSDPICTGHLVYVALRPDKTKVLRIHIDGNPSFKVSTYYEFEIDEKARKVHCRKILRGSKPSVLDVGWFRDIETFRNICENQPVPGESHGSKALPTTFGRLNGTFTVFHQTIIKLPMPFLAMTTRWLNDTAVLDQPEINLPIPVGQSPNDPVFIRWLSDVLTTVAAHHNTLWQRNNSI